MTDRDTRFHKESLRITDYRTPAQIDRDRVLYSPHFARLAEVTQVRAISGDFLVHNRLTHSLKVAQVARRIAEVLTQKQPDLANSLGLDPDVAEAAGLAHDLGHPPFGHIAEEQLNELVTHSLGGGEVEGYEGNAQSFRIVNALSVSDSAPEDQEFIAGLNLTKATLNAILKYPWLHRENLEKVDKWGSYETEKEIFAWARVGSRPFVRSVEAELMDWADDITYAIHDMVDFYCAGLIPLHFLANETNGGDLSRREWAQFFDEVCARKENAKIAANRSGFEDALRSAFALAGIDGPFTGSQAQSSDLWRFSSELISRYVGAIELCDPGASSDGRCVTIKKAARDQTIILKQLTWHYVIRRSDLATLQHGQKAIIETLYKVHVSAIKDQKWEFFPIGFSQLIRDSKQIPPARWAADYISGLTERQVVDLYRRLGGT
jgi:dGTPase